ILDRAARAHGLMSVDKDDDGTIRRVPLLGRVGNRLVPGVVVETLRLAVNPVPPFIDAISEAGGLVAIRVGPLTLPVQHDGTAWLHFSPHDPGRFYSAADVLGGKMAPDAFADQLVLIGVTGLGLVDYPVT